MSNTSQSMGPQRLVKIVAFTLLGLLLLARIGYGQTHSTENKNIILQSTIHLEPTSKNPDDVGNKIQPGTSVKLMVSVDNIGQQISPNGELYVRYAFAHPLENETKSVIFETEKKPLPMIEPGQMTTITFDTLHEIPSILDFVRYDWSIREYQAIAIINNQENVIGTLALTFSAYYYPGMKKEFPTKITPQ